MCRCCFSIITVFCTLVHHECTIFSVVLIGIALSKVQFVRTKLITYSVHKFNIGFHNSDLERSIWALSKSIFRDRTVRKPWYNSDTTTGRPIANSILTTKQPLHPSTNIPHHTTKTKTNDSGFHTICSVINCLGVGLCKLFYSRTFVTGLRAATQPTSALFLRTMCTRQLIRSDDPKSLSRWSQKPPSTCGWWRYLHWKGRYNLKGG
jgi:hypothetical protein